MALLASELARRDLIPDPGLANSLSNQQVGEIISVASQEMADDPILSFVLERALERIACAMADTAGVQEIFDRAANRIPQLTPEQLVARFIQKLEDSQTCCCETHLHQGVYLLHKIFGVPAPFQYVFYSSGAYSFALKHLLSLMRTRNQLKIIPSKSGVNFSIGAEGATLLGYPRVHEPEMDMLVAELARIHPRELKAMSSALIMQHEKNDATRSDVAKAIVRLRPGMYEQEIHDGLQQLESLKQLAAVLVR